LKNQLHTDEQEMFQFFNCFFFRKLIDNDPSRDFDGKEAFQRVRSWTKNIDDLFKKDYILIPVSYR
jgi:sentrin-specific protease 7